MHGRIGLGGTIAIAILVVASCAAPGAAGPASAVPSAVVSMPTPASPTPASTPSSPVTALCASGQLTGAITLWEGAAGSRIAHVRLTNAGGACLLSERLKPQLLDGKGAVLVDGTVSGVAATMARGATLETLVKASNYCGPAPVAPVTIGLVLTGRDRLSLAPPTATDATVPPCNGPTMPATLQMQPWAS